MVRTLQFFPNLEKTPKAVAQPKITSCLWTWPRSSQCWSATRRVGKHAAILSRAKSSYATCQSVNPSTFSIRCHPPRCMPKPPGFSLRPKRAGASRARKWWSSPVPIPTSDVVLLFLGLRGLRVSSVLRLGHVGGIEFLDPLQRLVRSQATLAQPASDHGPRAADASPAVDVDCGT